MRISGGTKMILRGGVVLKMNESEGSERIRTD
jgi:hypothetical protein